METFSALLAICAGNSPVTGEFPAQRPVTRSFGAFFDLHPNKHVDGWVKNGETGDLRRHGTHYDVTVMYFGVNKHHNDTAVGALTVSRDNTCILGDIELPEYLLPEFSRARRFELFFSCQ